MEGIYFKTVNMRLRIFHIFLLFLDSFLRSRDSNDHEVTAMMKAQFMSQWDGKPGNPHVMLIHDYHFRFNLFMFLLNQSVYSFH